MLPFVTRTDMFEAIKKADTKASDVDAFLATLLLSVLGHFTAEHNAVEARAQLISLWAENVSEQSEQLLEDDWAPLDSGVGEGLQE